MPNGQRWRASEKHNNNNSNEGRNNSSDGSGSSSSSDGSAATKQEFAIIKINGKARPNTYWARRRRRVAVSVAAFGAASVGNAEALISHLTVEFN